MLVLLRQPNQRITIGADIEISVLAVSGDKVRLGIEAPPRVSVSRKELWAKAKPGRRSDDQAPRG